MSHIPGVFGLEAVLQSLSTTSSLPPLSRSLDFPTSRPLQPASPFSPFLRPVVLPISPLPSPFDSLSPLGFAEAGFSEKDYITVSVCSIIREGNRDPVVFLAAKKGNILISHCFISY